MKNILLPFACLFILIAQIKAQTVTDYDGNVYNTVTIGTQVWMKQNLKVTHYVNGDVIPNVTDNTAWSGLTTGAYSYYDNSAANLSVYGNLYNYFSTVDTRKLCPTGWHIPEDWEWTNLETTLGGASVAGGAMKETGNTHWTGANTGATNSSNFTALPGGTRTSSGGFQLIGTAAFFGSASEIGGSNSWYRWLSTNNATSSRNSGSKTYGFSIRCISNSAASINENTNSSFNIYPNPVNNIINIDLPTNENFQVSIYDLIGNCVFQKQIENQITELNIGFLKSGLYLIVLKGKSGKSIQQKLIKE